MVLKLFGRRLRHKSFTFPIEHDVRIEGELADYQVLWAFVRDHERDPAFQLSLSLLKPGDVALDVGANVGLWALPAARLVGSHGSVHAFEPIPGTMQRLRRNISYNRLEASIHCVGAALCDRNGQITLYEADAAASYNSGGAGVLRRPGADSPVKVNALRLDTYSKQARLDRIDFLKVDVEGAELAVFRGASETLSGEAAPAIMFELDSSLSGALGCRAVDVKRFLADRGYQIFAPTGRGLIPVAVEGEHAHEDLFALKARHMESLGRIKRSQRARSVERGFGG